MSKNPTFLAILSILLIVNTAGFFLKYFDLDTYFILLGFRFHFSIVFFFLFTFKYIDFSSLKEMFAHPAKQRYIPVLLIAFLPLIIIPIDMFILEEFKLSEKDYFFELGLSSIIDFPVYLVWNAPQLFIFFIVMNKIITLQKYKFYKVFLISILLFIYEILPDDNLKEISSLLEINYLTVVNFILIALLSGLLISYINNIYLFALILFTILWGTVLFFGSSSEMVINIVLALQYESWSGLINPGRKYEFSNYLQPFYLLIIFLFSLFFLKKNKALS